MRKIHLRTPLRYMFESQYLGVIAILTFDVSGRVLKRGKKILYNCYLQKPNSTLWVQNQTSVQPK